MTRHEHFEFRRTKEIIERVHRRLGVKREYLGRDWVKDQQLLRESVRRKQALRQQESWHHGQPVVGTDAEAQEQQRAS